MTITIIKEKGVKASDILYELVNEQPNDNIYQLTRPGSFGVLLETPECEIIIGVIDNGQDKFGLITKIRSEPNTNSKMFVRRLNQVNSMWDTHDNTEFNLVIMVQKVVNEVWDAIKNQNKLRNKYLQQKE